MEQQARNRRQSLLGAIDKFRDKRVLVIGDSILDEAVYGTPIGKSLETPTLKLQHQETQHHFGGAAGVVRNIAELGGNVSFVTLLGDDAYAKNYQGLTHPNLKFLPVRETGRQTTVKRRFWADREKVLQVDHLDNRDISQASRQEVLDNIQQELANAHFVLVADYRHSMLSPTMIGDIKAAVAESKKRMIASSQISQRPSNHLEYSGIFMICMNEREAQAVHPDFSRDLRGLAKKLNSGVCVTLGENGSRMYMGGNEYSAKAIKVQQAEDACGAGDAFLAALALTGFETSPADALYLANCWAGLAVTTPGTSTPELRDLRRYIEQNE